MGPGSTPATTSASVLGKRQLTDIDDSSKGQANAWDHEEQNLPPEITACHDLPLDVNLDFPEEAHADSMSWLHTNLLKQMGNAQLQRDAHITWDIHLRGGCLRSGFLIAHADGDHRSSSLQSFDHVSGVGADLVSTYLSLLNGYVSCEYPNARAMFMPPNAWMGLGYNDDETRRVLRGEYVRRFYPSLDSVSQLQAIAFPVFIPNKGGKNKLGHWAAIIAFPNSRKVVYLDSYYGENSAYPEPSSQKISALVNLLDDILGSSKSDEAWTSCRPQPGKHHPKQAMDNYDCAFYMIANMTSHSLHNTVGTPLACYSQADMPRYRREFLRTLFTASRPPADIFPASWEFLRTS